MIYNIATTKPLILVDMDDSYVNYNAVYQKGVEELLPPEAFENEIKGKYFIEERFEEQYHEPIHNMMRSKGFFISMEPMEWAVEAMEEMLHEGMAVKFCTTPHLRSEFCFNEKIAWLIKYHGPQIEEEIVTTHDKTIVYGNVLIDDKDAFTGHLEGNPFWTHVIFETWYNQEVNAPHRLKHWKDWRKVVYPILKSQGF